MHYMTAIILPPEYAEKSEEERNALGVAILDPFNEENREMVKRFYSQEEMTHIRDWMESHCAELRGADNARILREYTDCGDIGVFDELLYQRETYEGTPPAVWDWYRYLTTVPIAEAEQHAEDTYGGFSHVIAWDGHNFHRPRSWNYSPDSPHLQKSEGDDERDVFGMRKSDNVLVESAWLTTRAIMFDTYPSECVVAFFDCHI